MTPTPPQASASFRHTRRALRAATWLLGVFVIIIVLLLAGVAYFAGTESGLPYVLRQVTRLTGGKLEIDGARGTLMSKLQVAELRWHGATTTIIARDVVVEWQPSALAHRQILVNALGAQSLVVDVAPSDTPATLPDSLGLPLDVVIEHASVAKFDWKLGERSGHVTGIAFGYAGNAREHRAHDVTLVFDQGRLDGDAVLGAAAPFALSGRVAIAGNGGLDGMDAHVSIDGTLTHIGVTASGRARDAQFDARAALTPFAASPLDTLDIDANDVDAAAFDAAWPRTQLKLTVHARPAAGGYAGSLALANAAPGRIDEGRIPLVSLTSAFAQDGRTIALRDLEARVSGDGRMRGSGSLALDTHAASASLALAGIDLHALHGALIASRIDGSVRVSGDATAQSLEGDLADRQRAIAVALAARVTNEQVTFSRAHVAVGGGTLDGRGTLALSGERTFAFELTAAHFDPSRLGAFAPGALEGRATLRGQLSPAWTMVADATLASGARLGVQPASGSAHALLSAGVARDVSLDVNIGAGHLSVHGNAGRAGDALAFAIDAPRVADIAPLLPHSVPPVRNGALRAQGSLAVEPAGVSGNIDAQLAHLALADGLSIASLTLKADIGAAHDAHAVLPFAQRALSIDIDASGVADATHTLAKVNASVRGTLAAHTLNVALAGAADHVSASAHGALIADGHSPLAWHGTLDTLDADGTLALTLRTPAAVELSAQHVHVGATTLAVAGGNVALGDLVVDSARVTSQGTFDGVPLDTLARLAGRPLPVASTLTLAGDWSLAATPRLNGTLRVHSQQGDVFAGDTLSPSAPDYALGIRALSVDARVHDDAWTLAASLASLRAGDATLQATLAAGATPGVPSLDAPLTLQLNAKLASLAPLQPWMGTSAVVAGRADVDIHAVGTLHAPRLTGTLAGDGLRVDAPQWGLAFADGRLHATLADNVVTLDTLTFAGGDGRFTATGTLGRVGAAGNGAHITWNAEHFRLLNRPDLTLVVTGEGSVASAPHKLALAGKVAIDRGAIVYAPRTALLGDDVIVKGAGRREPAQSDARVPALALDLEVDLGRSMTFTGEGLDAALGGRVHVTTSADGTLNGQGTISTTRGTYYAFGQQLSIDRGRLIFSGPLDNPALDIVALRKNIAVEAGVALTGTVRVPRIQLTSNPPVPDGEKLSWLITGQAPGTGTGADAAALAAASSYLLGGDGRPIGARIAQQVGLDDISVRSADSGPSGSASTAGGQVVSIGKRLSSRLTLVYEQGLTVATNALRLEYALSRTLTVRVEAGTISGIGLFYRRSYD